MIEAVIIAGSYSQYRRYIDDNRLSRHTHPYITGPEQLMGLRKVKIIKIGEWWKNPVINSDRFKILELSNKEEA